ncbi:hypothetical protein [Flavivirga jejuensis]|uniref:Uncharacterized protein n=1 Tax=Flavivirga jejuensis TaxID=870487 RepID=A0ABT8WLR0_9FLAO|nr:hypothetical protein [Flavivirga jejuensis]MDO5973990.1 hypothetical protein [Flavivirga jejuensis]
MKPLKIIFTCILFGYITHNIEAQNTKNQNIESKNIKKTTITLGFEKKSEIITYKESDTLTIPFSINIEGSYFPSETDDIEIEIISNSDELNLFLSNNTFKISSSKTKGELNFINNSNKLINDFKSLVNSFLEQKGIFTLQIKLSSKSDFIVNDNKISIDLNSQEKYIQLRPEKQTSNNIYNFYLGTNFDLENKVKANSFYSEIDVYLPDLFFKNKKENFWGGIRAGMYKNRSLSTKKERTSDAQYIEIIENLPENDSITIENKRIIRTPKVSYDNLGFYAELLLKIYNSKYQDFKVFLAPRAEVIQRVETTSYDFEDFVSLGYEKIQRDSLNSRNIRSLLSLNRERTAKYYNSYFGLGMPMFYNSKGIEIFLNPVFGMGDSAPFGRNNKSNKTFGLFQFHLIEKKSKIKLNGEIRKFFNANQDPFIVINLSKRIDIESLFSE